MNAFRVVRLTSAHSARPGLLARASGISAIHTTSHCNGAAAASVASPEDARKFLEANLPKWSPDSKRTGALALKVGMISFFDSWGAKQNCTVLQVDNCQVVEIKTKEKNGYTALQVGAGERKVKHVKKPQIGHFEKHSVPFKYVLKEFRVSEDALLPTGTSILAQHFIPGQYVDITGTSKGKGFQGVIKRHGFGGLRASHGVSKAHRKGGSTGQCQDPGRVFKGKKMAGRMGGDTVTADNLQVVKIDTVRNLIYIRGSVAGSNGDYVVIKDARKKSFASPPPFPTYFGIEGEEVAQELSMDAAEKDPLNLDDE